MSRKQLVPLDMNNNKIINLDTPTSGTDAANKDYVDSHSSSGGNVPFVSATAPASPTDGMLWWDTDEVDNSPATFSNAITVNGIQASATPQADKLYPLDSTGHYNPLRNKAVVCSLGLSSQLIPNGTVTAINFSSPLIDPYTMYSGTNPSRITIPTGFSGAWQVNGHVHYGSGIWLIRVYIYINGVQYFSQLLERASGSVMSVPISIVLPLNAGDYVELYTDHGSANPEYIYGEGGGGGARTRFEAIWLGAI